MTLYVCGEALIDFVPTNIANNEIAYLPKPGGSPYNVALAASRVGYKTHFIGNISTDIFGDILYDHLTQNGVDCTLSERSDYPSTLAFVDYHLGEPRYAFFNQNSTNINLNPQLPQNMSPEGAFHVGSISLIEPPAVDRIISKALSVCHSHLLSIDPNVRVNLIPNRTNWLKTIQPVMEAASIIKLSDEDLNFIAPDMSPLQFAQNAIAGTDKLLIVTHGSDGATAFQNNHIIERDVPVVTIQDTVGAGDTLMGTILTWLLNKGITTPSKMANVTSNDLGQMLDYGVTAAALNCTKSGCNPPSQNDIETALASWY